MAESGHLMPIGGGYCDDSRRARLYVNRTRGRLLQGLPHSQDGKIATESRRDTTGSSPRKGHIVDVDPEVGE